ncbi:MAG: aminodeoxychorismate synthase component I [Gammaproteobacteria bacterium]|nr:aminodeoxychorismate synthase component I [Gammaproteobacteria bacterium]
MTDRAVHLHELAAGPDLLALHAANPERYPFLLQSVASGTVQGRYDILFAFPGETIALDPENRLPGARQVDAFLGALDAGWRKEAIPRSGSELPFTGGWFVYLGYELAGEIEPKLRLDLPDDLPVAAATRIPVAIVTEHATGRSWIVAEEGHAQRIADVQSDIAASPSFVEKGFHVGEMREENPSQYTDAVARAIRYIIDGDVFQANLSRKWETTVPAGTRHADIYSRLRAANPGPFNGLATWGEKAVISSSPERLAEFRDGIVQTRPIAGTRPRGATPDEDEALTKELIGHPKERAEHVMLIDLERNDMGRVAKPGSVHVDEMMVLETYAHVHHIVSNIRAEAREDVTPGEIIAAVFPGGTITGCPKVRCMEIISELEASPRSAYTGSMGYLNRDGSFDLNILIRSMIRDGERLSFRAGAGIVYDSVPENELAETRAKARGLEVALAPRGDSGKDSR